MRSCLPDFINFCYIPLDIFCSPEYRVDRGDSLPVMSFDGYNHDDPYDSGFLPVSDIHKIHYEQYGKQDGQPVVFLHGGPGGSTSKASTIFFDPAVYRVVLFDQRGAGKSLPAAELRENTSQHLVSDIEALRKHLGIGKWHMVFGGSWGSTLALLYAETHPEAVGSLVVRGIFTVRKSEIAWTRTASSAGALYPEAHDELMNFLPAEERANPWEAYHKRLTSDDLDTRVSASRAWNKWELSISQLVPDADVYEALKDDTWSLQHARMEVHYESNGAFMEEGQLLKPENIAKIKHIPCTPPQGRSCELNVLTSGKGSIIQGRYDIVCPPRTAYDLHKALPDSKLYMIPDAGHSAKVGRYPSLQIQSSCWLILLQEPGTKRKLIEVCDEYRSL